MDIIDLSKDESYKLPAYELESKEYLLIKYLNKFYSNQINFDKMIPIILGESKISLRIMDWFVTNYSKKKCTCFQNKYDNKNIIVYLGYKSQLKAYSKKLFDPFCRRERIYISDNYGKTYCTTIGQLNFFRWAIKNGILDYIYEYLENIEIDMNKSIKQLYKNNKMNKKREISISVSKSVNRHDIKVIVKFD